MENNSIKAKVTLGLPLTAQERAIFLLFIATEEEKDAFLRWEAKQ